MTAFVFFPFVVEQRDGFRPLSCSSVRWVYRGSFFPWNISHCREDVHSSAQRQGIIYISACYVQYTYVVDTKLRCNRFWFLDGFLFSAESLRTSFPVCARALLMRAGQYRSVTLSRYIGHIPFTYILCWSFPHLHFLAVRTPLRS